MEATYDHVGITLNPDGTVTRRRHFPITAASSDPAGPLPVLTKDVTINRQNNTWARLYLPRHTITKLPLIVYYHAGGLIYGSAASTFHQNFCHKTVLHIPAVMVSVNYRLAPEHRLPAAYDDGLEALHWIKTTDDEWLTNFADLSKCFLMGSSAGGNITYHVGLRAAACADQLAPLYIRGLVLQDAFFGGVERTPLEMRLADDKILPLVFTDTAWELALPIGADRDHEYCNPTKGGTGELVEKVKNEGWKVLVVGCEGDPTVDRQMEVAEMLKEKGVKVIQLFRDGGSHGIDVADVDGSYANMFYEALKSLVLSY